MLKYKLKCKEKFTFYLFHIKVGICYCIFMSGICETHWSAYVYLICTIKRGRTEFCNYQYIVNKKGEYNNV